MAHWNLVWLWLWFLIGMSLYMLKRAYFLVKGPNPVATTYTQFVQVCWIPLLIRAAFDSGIFWACFTPQLVSAGLEYMGWTSFAWAVSVITQFGVCALFFGYSADSIVDFVITKVPFIRDVLPQMPAPLPLASVTVTKTQTTQVDITPDPTKAPSEK